MPPNSSQHLRLDVQGLRALAVLMVMAFHAGLPLKGGYIGVDVFFVVSGFVITTVLMREFLREGRIDWVGFFVRRLRRIGPALAVMLSSVLILSVFLLSPIAHQSNTAVTAIGASLIAANAVILRISGGYFDQPAETNPLLNTWSLSVEEQFYLVFPLLWLLALVWSKTGSFRARLGFLIGLLSLLSFTLMILWDKGLTFPGADTLLGYYGPLSRAWEFGVGSLLAVFSAEIRQRFHRKFATATGFIGLLFLLTSTFYLDKSTTWPGSWTLLPVLGTAAIIASGTVGTVVNRSVLGNAVLARIGDFSYSLYLWHWPLIVFSTLIWPTIPGAAVVAALISFVPALISYRFVEEPVRHRGFATWKGRIGLVAAVTLVPIVMAVGVQSLAEKYLAPRLVNGEVKEFVTGDLGGAPYRAALDAFFDCEDNFLSIIASDSRLTCHQSKAASSVEIAILGDSHALKLFLGVADEAKSKNVGYFSHGGMQPVDSSGKKMAEIINYVAESDSIDTVIISAWWNLYTLDPAGLNETVQKMTRTGKEVFLLDDVPDFTFDAFRCKYGVGGLIRMNPVCDEPSERNDQLRLAYLPILQEISEQPGVHLVTIYDYLCSDGICSMTKDNQILYQDSHHLNEIGSKYVISKASHETPALYSALGG